MQAIVKGLKCKALKVQQTVQASGVHCTDLPAEKLDMAKRKRPPYDKRALVYVTCPATLPVSAVPAIATAGLTGSAGSSNENSLALQIPVRQSGAGKPRAGTQQHVEFDIDMNLVWEASDDKSPVSLAASDDSISLANRVVRLLHGKSTVPTVVLPDGMVPAAEAHLLLNLLPKSQARLVPAAGTLEGDFAVEVTFAH